MTENATDLESRWADVCSEESMRCSTVYWNCRAEDYADFIVNSDFDHGRKILHLFEKEGMVNPDWNVLDIGSGPGAISIPFSEEVHAVTSVEPASEMVKKLLEQASVRKLSNISVVPLTWQDVPIREYIRMYDLVICSHSIWHFPDIFHQIERMQQVSRKYCALSHGIYQNGQADPISQKLGIPRDDGDRFIMVKRILENRGIFPQVSVVPTAMKRSVESARSMMVLGLKKYRDPVPEDLTLIDEHINSHSKGGMYMQEGKMGVLWWRVS